MQEKLVIRGGKPLRGEISARGAKNAVGKMMIAALLTDDPVTLKNIPRCGETDVALEIIKSVGAEVELFDHTAIIRTEKANGNRVSGISKRNRLPILAIGPLLHRCGTAEVPMVGGDRIGSRPVDFHISSLESLGAKFAITEDTIYAKTGGLYGAEIVLPYPSVGATENTILTAVLAKGTTILKNAAIEPEISDLAKMLNAMGAKISITPDRVVTIEGVGKLHGAEHEIIPDRIETASFGIMALATKGDITIRGTNKEHISSFIETVLKMGGGCEITDAGIRFFYKGPMRGIDIRTDTYPAFVTDWQQPMAVLFTQAEGVSTIHETVYEGRFAYAEDLVKMGAKMGIGTECTGETCRYKGKEFSHSAMIEGPSKLKAADLMMRDIRAGMAQMIAALVAEGESEIEGTEHIDRGYEDIDGRIRSLGGDIDRVKI